MPKSPKTIDVPSLKLIAAAKDYGVARMEIFKVNPDLVTFEKGFNVRADDDALAAHQEKLYLAMKGGAAIPPIDVRVENGVIICVEGHSRTIAARKLKKEVPDYVLEARQFRGNEQERVLHMLGTGNGQKPLTPLESGIGFLRLTKWGMTTQQIADKQGVSRVTVENCLQLAEAPVEVQELIKTGVVSSTTAREALAGGAEGIEALKKAAADVDPAKPTKGGKQSKKKKVTAKKLAGTPAAKKPSAAKKKPSKTNLTVIPAGPSAGVATDEIVVKLKKDESQVVIDFLKQYGPPDNPQFNGFIASIELALM